MLSFENANPLDPNFTWQDCAEFLYDGLMKEKINREDFIQCFTLIGEEVAESRIDVAKSRIFEKVLKVFFRKAFTNLKSEEKPAVFVVVGNKRYLVSLSGKEITINEADDLKDVPDNSVCIKCSTKADAKIAAWESKGKYVDRI